MATKLPEDRTGSASVPAGATLQNGNAVTLITIRVASGAEFELESFANYGNDVAAFGTPGLQWSIIVDGSLHPQFTRIRDQIGLQVNPRVVPAGLVVARSRMEFVVENDAASAFVAGVSMQGHHRPRE